MTNEQVMLNYDNNQQVVSLLQSSSDEHASQVMIFEVLRQLMASGISLDTWNEFSDCSWLHIVGLGCHLATLNPNVMMHTLSMAEIMSAADVAGSYFETGYQVIVDSVTPENKVTFTKQDGIV